MNADELISNFKKFFEEFYYSKIFDNIRLGKKRVIVEFMDIAKYNMDIADEMVIRPDETITAGEVALNELCDNKLRLRIRGDIPNSKYRLRDLRAKHLDRFITIEGTIETKTDVNVSLTSTRYECPSCGNVINVLQNSDSIKEPGRCTCGRKGKFRVLSSEKMDCFTMRLQELQSNVMYGSEMKMKSILCKEDLTDTIIEEKLVEGMKVKINGIYKEKYLMKRGVKQTQLITYIEANYIQISEETFYDIELNESDVKKIKEFAKNENIIEKISTNLFQGVYGWDKIKEALVLQAFGGVSNYKSIPSIRGDMHILLVGDPGQNKSVFIEFASSFNPKSVLVVGKSVSAVGLSGAVIKDELSGSYVLKPGAIPLANQGIICIDELDKMRTEDRDILHEPMEQQKISISKANLPDRKMLARESFLVSMNPKNSYFNDMDEIYKQIDLPATLVSRFDLVFIMKKNRVKDEHTREFEKEKAKTMMTRGRKDKQRNLIEFHNFMKKYIAYARQNINPKFDRYLEEEYIPEKFAGFNHERKEDGDTFPITPRHIWIIRRIAEARRRIFLDEHCTKEDVDYAIEKINGSLKDIAVDINTGKLDQEWISDGVGTRDKRLIEVFDDVFEKLEDSDKNVNGDSIYSELTSMGFKERDIDHFIYAKKNNGDLLEIRNNIYRKV